MPRWIVEADAIVGTSPMGLPDRCVKCGRYVSDSQRVEATLYWYPRGFWWWVWGVYAYVIQRRPLEISYTLCPQHVRSLRRRQQVAFALWALCLALVLAAYATRANWICVVGALILFIAALIVQRMARLPLWAARHEDGIFRVRGFGRDFLSAVKGPDVPEVADA